MNRLATVKKYRNKQSLIILILVTIFVAPLILVTFKNIGVITNKELSPSNTINDYYRTVIVDGFGEISLTDAEDEYFLETLTPDNEIILLFAKDKTALEKVVAQIEEKPTRLKGVISQLAEEDVVALKTKYKQEGYYIYTYALELNRVPSNEYIVIFRNLLLFSLIPLFVFLHRRRSRSIIHYLKNNKEINTLPATISITKDIEIVGNILFSYQRLDFVDLTKYVDFQFLILRPKIITDCKFSKNMGIACIKPTGMTRTIVLPKINNEQCTELEKALQPYRKTGGEGSIDTSTITTKPSF